MNNSFLIRSITLSIKIKDVINPEYQEIVRTNLSAIEDYFKKNSVAIRTFRFNVILGSEDISYDVNSFLQNIRIFHEFIKSTSVRWFCISLDLSNEELSVKQIKNLCKTGIEIIKKYENSFVNFIVCREGKLVPIAVKEASSSIIKISRLSFNGFDNFRVGVSLNPGANTPFFPFSVPSKSEGFSIALEITKGITELLENSINQDFYTRLENIKNVVGEFLQKINTISNNISNTHHIEYFGLDASLAPYPDNKTSVVDILSLLGLQEFGSNGTLFFTSILTDLIKEIISFNKIKFVGFNGVMYSLLEDNLMCDANNKKLFSMDSLLAYSTVCGCGIDMIPVPGNILDEELASVIFDVAAISSKLNKSLGVRILPIPGGEENENTKFDMDFISNTRIMKVRNICIEDRLFEEKLIKYFKA